MLRTFVLSFILPVTAFATIQGPNNLRPVALGAFNIPAQLRPIANAIGMMAPMGCTATHIGSNVVLTAGHCFNSPENLVENQPCDGIQVNWRYRGTVPHPMISRCVRIIAMQLNGDVDYAVFQVDRAPREYVQIDTRTPMSWGQTLTILSHPLERPLMWSRVCRLMNRPEGLPPEASSKMMYHRCDTEPGSSGAAILDWKTLRIVAIHDGSFGPVNYGTPLRKIPLEQILKRSRLAPPPPIAPPMPLPFPPEPPPVDPGPMININ